MKRPILVITIAYINGIILGVYLYKSIPLIVLIICIIMLSIFPTKYKKIVQKKWIIILFYISIVCLSGLYSYSKNMNYDNKYKFLDKQTINIIGTVVSSLQDKEYKKVYTIKVESVNGSEKFNGDYLLVNVEKNADVDSIKYGEKISFSGKYEEPSISRNYKGFSYKDYLKSKKIYGIITQDISSTKIIKEKNVNYFNKLSYNFVEILKLKFKDLLPERTANLEIGILLGYSDDIDEDVIQSFKNSNLTHMLAVSGENTVYIIMVIGVICNKRTIGNKMQKIITIIIVLIFVKVTGATLSVTRAGITCVIYMIASLLYRKADVKNTIAIATLITILNNPFNIFNVGMQLSYAGTISILLFYNALEKRIHTKKIIIKYILDSMILTISANIFIIPIMIYHFNTISFTFIFSNLFAGPLVGIATIIGFGISLLSIINVRLAVIPAMLLNAILKLVILIAEIFSKMTISKISVVTPNICLIIMIYIVEILIIKLYKNDKLKMIKQYSYKIFIVVLIIILIFSINNVIPKRNKLIIHFIDVGQGDSTLIITASDKKILIDGGGSSALNSFDVGEETLLPYLLDRQISRLDYIMVSHFDSDHCQGLEAVIANIKVKNIIVSKQSTITDEYSTIIKLCQNKKVNIIEVKREDKIIVDKYTYFKILNPGEKLENDSDGGLNANAIVAKLYYKQNNNYFTMLFTGDIESETESKLVNIYGNELKSDILKTPHHGSKTSSTENFLERVKPNISLIGVGAKNKFGHPNSEVLDRLKKIGSTVYRTDECGEITIVVYYNKKIKINKQIC